MRHTPPLVLYREFNCSRERGGGEIVREWRGNTEEEEGVKCARQGVTFISERASQLGPRATGFTRCSTG